MWSQTWIVGKWVTPREQWWAPPGTHFHQFVVPPIIGFRRDCTYGALAAMKLPEDVQGLAMCEVWLPYLLLLLIHTTPALNGTEHLLSCANWWFLISFSGANVTVHDGPRCRSRLSRRRSGSFLGRMDTSRGWCDRCGQNRCSMGCSNEAWAETCVK